MRKVTESGQCTVYKLGKKYEPDHPGAHQVVSTYLSEAEYKVLAGLPARISRKRRLSVCGGALDLYEFPNPGLKIFEVEFATSEEAVNYIPPSDAGREVTQESEFTGHALASEA